MHAVVRARQFPRAYLGSFQPSVWVYRPFQVVNVTPPGTALCCFSRTSRLRAVTPVRGFGLAADVTHSDLPGSAPVASDLHRPAPSTLRAGR